MSEVVQSEPAEFARFFSIKDRGIVSYRGDGRIFRLALGQVDFAPYRTKKADFPIEEWIAAKKRYLQTISRWCFEATELPSLEELEEMCSYGTVTTPTGHEVEPDGVGPDGVPSWLRCLGMI